MFIRQFSVRWLLLVTSVCAVFCFLLAMAVNGHRWVIAIVAGIAAFFLVMVVHAALYLLISLLPIRSTAQTGQDRKMARLVDGRPRTASPSYTGTER